MMISEPHLGKEFQVLEDGQASKEDVVLGTQAQGLTYAMDVVADVTAIHCRCAAGRGDKTWRPRCSGIIMFFYKYKRHKPIKQIKNVVTISVITKVVYLI